MPSIAAVAETLAKYAPLELAEDWDNVGLLVGDPERQATSVLVCLTLTPDVVDEAIQMKASLVITHHPLPFRPLKRITTDTIEGDSLWRLIGAGVAIYSMHTAYDSAALGVNQQIATGLELTEPMPFVVDAGEDRVDGAGTGRIGRCSPKETLATLADRTKSFFGLSTLRVVGDAQQSVTRLAIACGSGGSLMDDALAAGCDAFLTGEATFHDCLKAKSHGIALLLVGHYTSERFAIEQLATQLANELPSLQVLASKAETDPIGTI